VTAPTLESVASHFAARGFWRSVARPNQLAPQGDWDTWLLLAGRGFGKTRTGAEWCIEQALLNPGSRGALVAPTAADCRDIMVEGESGIMACAPPGLCVYEPSKRRVTLANGSLLTLYSADEPDRLRGPQHHYGWLDELASWRRLQATWDMLQMGMRLGAHPKICITTTPRPLPLVKQLVKDPTTHVVRGSTYDNLANLAPTFRRAVVERYEGTTLGRQELHADILDDLPGALVPRALIESARVDTHPQLETVVVAVDPAGTGTGDRAGIVAMGRADGHHYVLADVSQKLTARATAQKAWALYHQLEADVLVVEDQYGKDWVVDGMKRVWEETESGPAPIKKVGALVGKKLRAQPTAMRFERGVIHMVGVYGELEDQLATWDPLDDPQSPDNLDAMVHADAYLAGRERSRGRLGVPKQFR
jgi:phage terminase large subunit-like protein